MATDGEAAAEITRQIALMRRRVAHRGVFGYLDDDGERKDVNKLFLANTVRGVDAHNRRHEEAKCWKIKEMEERLEARASRRRRSHSRSRSRSRSRSCNRSRSSRSDEQRGRRRHRHGEGGRCRDRSLSRDRQELKSRRRAGRRRSASPSPPRRGVGTDERAYWARKKAEKTEKMWRNLRVGGSVSVESAPTFGGDSADDSSDGDVKVRKPRSKSRKGAGD